MEVYLFLDVVVCMFKIPEILRYKNLGLPLYAGIIIGIMTHVRHRGIRAA